MKKLVLVVVSLVVFADWLATTDISVNPNHAIAQYNAQLIAHNEAL